MFRTFGMDVKWMGLEWVLKLDKNGQNNVWPLAAIT